MCRKMQKSPALIAGDELFLEYFTWFSSIGSHMGQQSDTTWCLFLLFGHMKCPPLMNNFGYYTMKEGNSRGMKPRFSDFCGITCLLNHVYLGKFG